MITIHALPENVLLEIFKFYVDEASEVFPEDAWHTLVHVCQRWRFIVFASPHHLDLQILCTNESKVEKNLHIWPQLPIALDVFSSRLPVLNNITAALKHHHRVSRIFICDAPNSVLKELGAMKNPFPALTDLALGSDEPDPQVLPHSFLLGSAPRLQTLSLRGISFPALPKLLMSTSDLVELHLYHIPPSGYVSPQALAASLSMLTKLESFSLLGQSLPSWDDRADPLPPRFTRAVLPSLTYFDFNGYGEYLEPLVSRIEGPLLRDVSIEFSDQLAFDASQLRHFFSRTETFKAPHRADMEFTKDAVRVDLFWRNGIVDQKKLQLTIPCSRSSWQVSAITHVYSSPLPPLFTLERLGICECQS